MRKCLVAFAMCVFLCGCGARTHETRFAEVGSDIHYNPTVLYDKETGVEYFYSAYGGLTPIIDRDGKPIIYEGYGE